TTGSPMPIVLTTRRVLGSTRVTVPSRASPTQRPPCPAAVETGFEPTRIDATTRLLAGSITASVGGVAATDADGSSATTREPSVGAAAGTRVNAAPTQK